MSRSPSDEGFGVDIVLYDENIYNKDPVDMLVSDSPEQFVPEADRIPISSYVVNPDKSFVAHVMDEATLICWIQTEGDHLLGYRGLDFYIKEKGHLEHKAIDSAWISHANEQSALDHANALAVAYAIIP